MTMIDSQDKALSDALATMSAPVAPESTRRTFARESTPAAPLTGYRVTIEGTDIDVDATDHGDAVVEALTLPTTPARFGGYVFMFRYTVADSTGLVLDGGERLMRELLEAARIRRK